MLTHSAKETMQLGERLARHLSPGDIVALYGELGSGKTTFTKGVGKGLGVEHAIRISSPSFVMIKEYEARIPLYHIDLYRLTYLKDMQDIAIEEYIFGDGVAVVEWAEKIENILPARCISVRFAIKGKTEREINVNLPMQPARLRREVDL